MEINALTLHHFRNYEYQDIGFTPGINALQGQNGQGKTNVLEGIYYLLTGKSYRVHKEQELTRWGENGFHLYGEFTAYKRPLKLESHYQEKKKVMKINQIPCRKLSEYVGTINVVFFSPDDLVMIKGGPAERRRFLDLHIMQLYGRHIHALNAYNKALQQKSALLKQKFGDIKKDQLEIWNYQLVEFGSQIMRNRWEYTTNLAEKTKDIYTHLTSGSERLTLRYVPLGKKNLEEALENYPLLLEEKMRLEIERHMVLVGPHRDDIDVQLNEKSARLFGSQGQQRSIVLSLKLAELEAMAEVKGEFPLLLLDDVLSELDNYRRDYLLNYIDGLKQTIITMTTAETIKARSSSLFIVEKGRIRRLH